jgi:hypothetical protein
VFYHRQTNLHQFSRQACAEPISIKQDGSIPQVETTSCGLNGGPLAGRGEYEARIACNLQSKNGVFSYGMVKPDNREHPYVTQETLDCEEIESQYIANMKDGSTAAFKYFFMDGADYICAVVRGSGSGVFEVSTEMGAAPIAKISIQPGDEWHTISASLSSVFGKQALYFCFRGNGSIDFKSFRLGA